jgi:L-lactate dehydrogenase
MCSQIDLRYNPDQLLNFATQILNAAGLEANKSAVVAETLVEADLLGHTTHGLQLLESYSKEIQSGNMTSSGEPEIINDLGAAITWNGNYLPGPWLVHKAIDLALERISLHPVVTLVIQKSHHIACLAAYLEKVTSKGYLMMLSCSDPRNTTVAPFGGMDGVYSPNPIAAGIPTQKNPILIDVSMSATANASIKKAADKNVNLPHPWLLKKDGAVTDDPKTFFDAPPSTILPLGNLDTGYKGFGMGLIVESLTNGLSGYGRANNPSKWTASVFLQILNPEAFGGSDSFKNETQYLVDQCEKSASIDLNNPVRMPGRKALNLKNEQKQSGLALETSLLTSLKKLGIKFSIPFPEIQEY